MSLKYALLGFLSTEPSSGYTLAQEFSESMGWFWSASHSQIYPELRRLEEQGLVASHDVESEGGKVKRIYELTPVGHDDLREWVEKDNDYPPQRDAERIRLVFLDQAPLEVIERHLHNHVKHHENLLAIALQQLAEVRAGTFPRTVKRLATRPVAAHPAIVALKALAVQGNVDRARTEIAWAQDALTVVGGLPSRDGRVQA